MSFHPIPGLRRCYTGAMLGKTHQILRQFSSVTDFPMELDVIV